MEYVKGRLQLHLLNSNCCSVSFECFYRLHDNKSQWDDKSGMLLEPELIRGF